MYSFEPAGAIPMLRVIAFAIADVAAQLMTS